MLFLIYLLILLSELMTGSKQLLEHTLCPRVCVAAANSFAVSLSPDGPCASTYSQRLVSSTLWFRQLSCYTAAWQMHAQPAGISWCITGYIRQHRFSCAVDIARQLPQVHVSKSSADRWYRICTTAVHLVTATEMCGSLIADKLHWKFPLNSTQVKFIETQ